MSSQSSVNRLPMKLSPRKSIFIRFLALVWDDDESSAGQIYNDLIYRLQNPFNILK